jgi:hypothetical protein
VLPRVIFMPRQAQELRERNAEYVLARRVQGNAEPLVIFGRDDVRMRSANLMERASVGLRAWLSRM